MNLSHLQNWKPRNKQKGFLQFLPLIGAGLGLLSSRNQPDQQTTSQGGSSTSTQTTQVNPALTQNAMMALNQAGDLFRSGQRVAGLPSQFGLADMEAQRLAQFQPGTSMFSSGGQINPFIQSAFDRASNLTQPRLASEFSASGRLNSPAHQTRRADELGAISSNLLLPLMESERGRQFSAVEGDLSRQIAGAGIRGGALPTLFNSALTRRGVQQEQLDAPQASLNQFIGRLGGLSSLFPATQTQSTNSTGSVTQPVFNNPLSSALGGAILGSNLTGSFGNQQKTTPTPFVPGIGGALGAIGGPMGGMLGSIFTPGLFG